MPGWKHPGIFIFVISVRIIYTLHGKNIVHLTHGSSDWMHFFYDASGKVASVNYNGQRYAYLYNMQGDVVGLLDSTGAEVVKYTYDAWGKQLSKTGSLASTLGTIQPFRYRGYVYDEETGLYYLRSRYYNPTWGRFVNADAVMGFCASLKNRNLFTYCENNPSVYIDSEGQTSTSITSEDNDYLIEHIRDAMGGGGLAIAGYGLFDYLIKLKEHDFSDVTISKETTSDDVDPRIYTVYCLSDQQNVVQYVGRTKNYGKRIAAHGRNPFRSHLKPSYKYTGLTKEEARALEQTLMIIHHTLNPANKTNNQINGISPRNSNGITYYEALRTLVINALPYFENQVSNEILNLLE